MDVLYPMEGYTINYMCGVPGNWAIYKLSKYAGSDWENEKYTSTSEIVLIVWQHSSRRCVSFTARM